MKDIINQSLKHVSLTGAPKFEFNHTNATILNILKESLATYYSHTNSRLVYAITRYPIQTKKQISSFRGLVQNWKKYIIELSLNP